jgi:hypothetical protein
MPIDLAIVVLAIQQTHWILEHIFSDKLVLDFLFRGEIKPAHQTKFALEKIIARYQESIDSLNRAIIVSVAFVPIALLLSGSDVKIPMIEVSVKYRDWIRLCPAISFGIQFFTLIALSWFLILRRGLRLIEEKVGDVEYFGDVSDMMLKGVIGSLWTFSLIPKFVPSRVHLIWLIPLLMLFLIMLMSPSVLCAYFIIRLFAEGNIILACLYSFLLVPGIFLGLLMMGISALAGTREPWWKQEKSASAAKQSLVISE